MATIPSAFSLAGVRPRSGKKNEPEEDRNFRPAVLCQIHAANNNDSSLENRTLEELLKDPSQAAQKMLKLIEEEVRLMEKNL